MARVKMVGNMIELNSPTASTDHMAKDPEVVMVVTTSRAATQANSARMRPGLKYRRSGVPRKRPTIAPPQ